MHYPLITFTYHVAYCNVPTFAWQGVGLVGCKWIIQEFEYIWPLQHNSPLFSLQKCLQCIKRFLLLISHLSKDDAALTEVLKCNKKISGCLNYKSIYIYEKKFLKEGKSVMPTWFTSVDITVVERTLLKATVLVESPILIFSLSSLRYSDVYICESGRCCTLSFFLTFLSLRFSR